MPISKANFLAEFLKIERDLRAMIGAMVPDSSVRDDIFQETSIVIWNKFESYDPERSFKAWVRGIASYEVLKYRTKSVKIPLAFSEEALFLLANLPHGAVIPSVQNVKKPHFLLEYAVF